MLLTCFTMKYSLKRPNTLKTPKEDFFFTSEAVEIDRAIASGFILLSRRMDRYCFMSIFDILSRGKNYIFHFSLSNSAYSVIDCDKFVVTSAFSDSICTKYSNCVARSILR